MLTALLTKGRTALTSKTIFGAYNETKARLSAAGIEDFGFEARVIIRHITGFDNKKILLNYNTELNSFQCERLDEITARRQARYPLQYILGEWDFYGHTFKVGEGVLVPRADTETVVDTALELIKNIKNPRVLDLCAGSGAIGVSIAAERSDSRVFLVEKYEAAAKYLKENIKLNCTDNAKYLSGDVLAGDFLGEKYDLIVSNPPYVASGEIKALQPEVTFEPTTALDGGEDGLTFYRAIICGYKRALNSGGVMCFEAGINEARQIKELMADAGFKDIGSQRDFGGVDRVVFGTVK